MTLPETWPPEVELEELEHELARERRAYDLSLRAQHDRRVCDADAWKATVLRRRLRIGELERERSALRAKVAA